MGLLAWFFPTFFWWPRINFPVRLLVCLTLTFAIMTVSGAVLSALVHSIAMGGAYVANAIASDPGDVLKYLNGLGFVIR